MAKQVEKAMEVMQGITEPYRKFNFLPGHISGPLSKVQHKKQPKIKINNLISLNS